MLLQVSPDGLLVQAAIQADHVDFAFKDGEQGTVPGSYLELAQRLRLPEFEGLEVSSWRLMPVCNSTLRTHEA